MLLGLSAAVEDVLYAAAAGQVLVKCFILAHAQPA
jgi:hypothetical protein